MKDALFDQKLLLSPSLISCCDLCELAASVRELESAGMDLLHVDVLDGHFSPSMPLGLDTVRQLRARTDMAFDVHVMTASHDFFISELLDIGVQQLVFHVENEPHIDWRLNQIHAAGVRAGVALKPATPLSVLDYVLDKCDAVLLMCINPGYAQCAGEGKVPYADRKIRDLRQRIRERGLNTKIILDGRISKQDLADYGTTGLADIFVTGSTCINKKELKSSAAALRAYRQRLLGEEA